MKLNDQSLVIPRLYYRYALEENKQSRWSLRIFKLISVIFMFSTILVSVYAYRQRAWADQLHSKLVQANLDDMMLWRVMTLEEKQSVSDRFRERGETRIADWISQQ